MAERAHTPGPWAVEHTMTAGLRIVHGESDADTGFRDDVPMGRGDKTEEAKANVTLAAAAPQLLDSLLAVEWAGEGQGAIDCCPKCGADAADRESPEIFDGKHFTDCELRDSLDAALGVTSPRIERAHG